MTHAQTTRYHNDITGDDMQGYRQMELRMWSMMEDMGVGTTALHRKSEGFHKDPTIERGSSKEIRYAAPVVSPYRTQWPSRSEPAQWEGTGLKTVASINTTGAVDCACRSDESYDSLWEYPAAWTVDNNMNTEWTSRFGALEAQLIYDLGYRRNVAGMTWSFGHVAGRVDVPRPRIKVFGHRMIMAAPTENEVHYADRNDNRSNWQRATCSALPFMSPQVAS
ncbi:unnamed protein product [Symbiodinium sp. KB8]|nr:unnamed protein product [Symbiodinium sp. KB8]